MRIIGLFLIMGALLTGCASVTLTDLDYSLVDLSKAISNVIPKGAAKISPNRRTYTSKYFDPETLANSRTTERADDIDRERAFVEITIMGDRRPYDLDIDVYVEEDTSGMEPKKDDDFIDGQWHKVGRDKGLAKNFRERLANYLARLERNKNLIDDFRPF